MRSARLFALLVCASLLAACAGSMQSASTATSIVKRPVRASKGSVEKSPAR